MYLPRSQLNISGYSSLIEILYSSDILPAQEAMDIIVAFVKKKPDSVNSLEHNNIAPLYVAGLLDLKREKLGDDNSRVKWLLDQGANPNVGYKRPGSDYGYNYTDEGMLFDLIAKSNNEYLKTLLQKRGIVSLAKPDDIDIDLPEDDQEENSTDAPKLSNHKKIKPHINL